MMRKIQMGEKINGHYVYLLLDPTTDSVTYEGINFPHKPFYLGKGKNNRVFDHLREARIKNHHNHKVHTIRKVWDCGLDVAYFIIADNLTDEEALKIEGKWGDVFGYRFDGSGILTNGTKTGTRNPVLFGENNGFFKRKHTAETKKKIGEAYTNWYATLSEERKQQLNKKRSDSAKGRVISKELSLRRLQAKFGPTYTEVGQLGKQALIKKQIKREAFLNKRRKKAEEKALLLKVKEQKLLDGTYWSEIKGGCKNPMYGKGELLAGNKNGRAKMQLITILDYTFLVHGNFKHFVKDLKQLLGCKNPFVSRKAAAILKPQAKTIIEGNEVPDGSIEYTGLESLRFLGEIYARTCNKKH